MKAFTTCRERTPEGVKPLRMMHFSPQASLVPMTLLRLKHEGSTRSSSTDSDIDNTVFPVSCLSVLKNESIGFYGLILEPHLLCCTYNVSIRSQH